MKSKHIGHALSLQRRLKQIDDLDLAIEYLKASKQIGVYSVDDDDDYYVFTLQVHDWKNEGVITRDEFGEMLISFDPLNPKPVTGKI